MIGAILGSYRITGALSAGGMGMVYRARHELLDRPAAIKLLRPELTADDELVQRFFNEAKAATAIRHPGIVEVYDFGYTDDGHAYLVMEFLDGDPLGRRLEQRGRLTEPEAIAIARGIASALKAAHGKGIIHRDLKPDNIFLVADADDGERIKVLDFGIAKLANPPSNDRRTRTGVLMGTPRYMAPEQAREAGTIDHRADLYSLGCILYELLVGAPPFVAEGAGEIIALQLFADPEPPRARVESISPALEALVLRLLAKEPADRPASAHEVMQELARIAGHVSGPIAVPRSAAVASSQVPLVRTHEISSLDTLPAVDAATIATPRPRRGAPTLALIAATGVLLVVGIGVAVFARSSGGGTATPDAAAAAVVAPAVVPAIDAAIETAPPAPPPLDEPVVLESADAPVRATRRGKRSAPPEPRDRAVEIMTVDRAAPPPSPKGPTTANGSPIEIELGTEKAP